MKNIFNVYVVMESQEQCDRMKQLCIDNGLAIWVDEIAFDYNSNRKNYFVFSEIGFAVYYGTDRESVTETEFLQLLKKYKDGR